MGDGDISKPVGGKDPTFWDFLDDAFTSTAKAILSIAGLRCAPTTPVGGVGVDGGSRRNLEEEVQSYSNRCDSYVPPIRDNDYTYLAPDVMRYPEQLVPFEDFRASRDDREVGGSFYTPRSLEELDQLYERECYVDFRFPAYPFRTHDNSFITICHYLLFWGYPGGVITGLASNLTDPGDHRADEEECEPALRPR